MVGLGLSEDYLGFRVQGVFGFVSRVRTMLGLWFRVCFLLSSLGLLDFRLRPQAEKRSIGVALKILGLVWL